MIAILKTEKLKSSSGEVWFEKIKQIQDTQGHLNVEPVDENKKLYYETDTGNYYNLCAEWLSVFKSKPLEFVL